MKTYEIKRYDSLSAYEKDNLDQCTPVVITEEHMTTYLLCVHCDSFATALNQFCEVFANENVDWKPVVDYILEQDKYSNFWIGFTGDFSYVFLWKEIWKENGLCKVKITFYRWNIPTDETTGEEIKEESNAEAEADKTTTKASGDLPKTIHFMDDIKGISEMSYQELEEYSESIIRGNIFYLEHNGYFNGYGNEEMDYIDEYAIQAKAEWEKVKKQLRENPDLVLMIDKTNILYVPVVARKGGDDRNG